MIAIMITVVVSDATLGAGIVDLVAAVPIASIQPGRLVSARPVGLPRATATLTRVQDGIEVLAGRRTAVLTGAGLSTDSGIPDYRGPHSPRRTPMTIAEFRSGPVARQRYWARSHIGWARMRAARPNGGHHALAALQAAGAVTTLITQNVDGLHQAAGSTPVVDLHGRLDTVVCLDCGRRSARLELQHRLSELNPGFGADGVGDAATRDDGAGDVGTRDDRAADRSAASRSAPNGSPRNRSATDAQAIVAPDGDADVTDTSMFVVAPCLHCAGVLKPDVVFFGENVPVERVRSSYRAVQTAQALLVAGSSLTVMSGLRFVKRAAAEGIPVVIINRGMTRGNGLATVTIDAGCTSVLQELANALT